MSLKLSIFLALVILSCHQVADAAQFVPLGQPFNTSNNATRSNGVDSVELFSFQEFKHQKEEVQLLSKTGCPCEPTDFDASYVKAFSVVRVKVIKWKDDYKLTQSGRIPYLVIRLYMLEVQGLYKGKWPRSGRLVYAQSFTQPSVCGVRLAAGSSYLLFVENPFKRTKGTFWYRGLFLIERCQGNYNWHALSSLEARFLSRREKF